MIDTYGPRYAELDLPIIDGLATKTGASDTDSDRGELAARVIQALKTKPAVARRLSQVDVTDQHNAAVILNGEQAVIYVGDDRFLPRIESYLDLASALRARVADTTRRSAFRRSDLRASIGQVVESGGIRTWQRLQATESRKCKAALT